MKVTYQYLGIYIVGTFTFGYFCVAVKLRQNWVGSLSSLNVILEACFHFLAFNGIVVCTITDLSYWDNGA